MEQTKKLNMTAMSDKTNSNTTAKKEEPAWEHKVAMKVSGVSIAVNLLLSLFKLLAGILAHSGAMISDAIHSASDVGSTFVVIVGVNLSSKKSDKEHQYGHERMECVSSIILSGLLLATGIGIGMNGIENIIKSTSGASIAIPGTLALIAAVVSIVVKEWMFWYTRGAAKKINSGALMADAVATTAGAVMGTSTTTTFVESASGVTEGGRTGLTSMTTAILFLLSLLLSPVFLAIPSFATAPALIIVGFYMIGSVSEIDFKDPAEGIPAFLCIIAMPFFYSISEGISMGVISYVVLNLMSGKAKEKKISPVMYVLAVMFLVKYVLI